MKRAARPAHATIVSPAKVVPTAAFMLAGGEYGVGELDEVPLVPVVGLLELTAGGV